MASKRSQTRPIPDRLHKEFYLAMRDLAFSGRFYRSVPMSQLQPGEPFFQQFGHGSSVSRRHGLVILWSTACALRFNEIRAMRLDQVDVESCTARVQRSKGSKDESIRVDRLLIECTQAWHRRSQIRSPLLLPNEFGRPISNKLFNRDAAGPIGRIFGIKLTHHCFRDTACDLGFIEAARRGLDARAVQRLMGHSSAEVTEIYARKSAPLPIQVPLFATEHADGD